VTRKAVFRDPDGRDVLVGVISDITERKRLEELLRLNAQVFEHSTEGMFITDVNNDILRVNRAFTEITGYAAQEVLGKNPRMLGSGQLPREFYAEMWRSLSERGYWQGEMLNRRRSGELYAEWLTISTVRDAAGQLQHYIALFSDITKRKQAEERILFLAHHDALTGLPNRVLLGDRVAQAVARAVRSGAAVALLMLDLDHFKEINDQLGHQAGDRLLKDVAHVLSGAVRGSDTVARLGGDEFVVLLADGGSPRDAQAAAERILKALELPFELQGRQARVGASIGIGVFPRDGTDADALLRSADEALYRVKRSGRNNFAFAEQPSRETGRT
jgi:diguanylate cyclase (GGDEF)-like protein/PAS domain S-box-containing protein